MPSLTAAQNINAAFCPSYIPVAIFVGGTAGIGQAMAEAFARYTVGRAHIIIVGRNRKAAESILASFPKPADASTEWTHQFVSCDIQLMKNIRATTRALLERFPKVNFLVLTAGLGSLSGRQETEEGIDKMLATRYYSRWAFTDGMLPALRSAKEAGQAGSVLTILGAGLARTVDVGDLGLKQTFSGMKAMTQSTAYNDLMVAEYAKREPEIAFTHIFPGTVNTSSVNIEGWLFNLIYFIVRPLIRLTGVSPQECAEYMLYALFEGEKGLYRRTKNGDDIGMNVFPGTEEDQKKLWDHTFEAVHGGQIA